VSRELGALPVSSVDQARGIALRLLAAIERAGMDLEAEDRHLARAIAEDPSLFWARGEEKPPGVRRQTDTTD
jgi:hypothetical protein